MVLQIEAPSIEAVQRQLKGMSGKAPVVQSKAINDTINYVSREMVNEARKEYVVKITAAKKTLSIKKARQSSLSGEVLSIADKKVPLHGFRMKPAKREYPNPSHYAAKVKQKGGFKPLTGKGDFSKGFIATMQSGHTGAYQRTGRKTSGGKEQITELFGPSIPSMFKSEDVSKSILDKGEAYLKERLKIHIKTVMEMA